MSFTRLHRSLNRPRRVRPRLEELEDRVLLASGPFLEDFTSGAGLPNDPFKPNYEDPGVFTHTAGPGATSLIQPVLGNEPADPGASPSTPHYLFLLRGSDSLVETIRFHDLGSGEGV